MSRLHFELVTPEKTFFIGEVDQVVVPGSEGEMTILHAHEPLMTLMNSGVIQFTEAGKQKAIFIQGGFADVSTNGLKILAENAINVDELNAASITKQISDAQDDLKDAKTEAEKSKANTKLSQLKDMLHYAKN